GGVNRHRPRRKGMPGTSGTPTGASRRREARLVTSRRRATSSAAESTAPVCVLLDRRPELLRPEVGPERVGEHVLGVRGLPEEEVRGAALAGSADDEVRVRHLGLVEAGSE